MNPLSLIRYSAENATQYTSGQVTVPIAPRFLAPPLAPPAAPIANAQPPGIIDGWYRVNAGLPAVLAYTPDSFDHPVNNIFQFVCTDDTDYLQDAIEKHWQDLCACATGWNGVAPDLQMYDLETHNPYHLIYAYMLENTGIFHIFREFISKFYNDEQLTKVGLVLGFNMHAMLANVERLFYGDSGTSSVRPNPLVTRANAYFRMFGVKINWNPKYSDQPPPFHQARIHNGAFVASLEAFLKGFWDAYTNANNTGGPNNTDLVSLTESARQLRLQLMGRRSEDGEFNPGNYFRYHLSRVEFSAAVSASWLRYLINPGSPIATYLRLDGNTPGDVLLAMGDRVGIPAHSQSLALFDLADDIADTLRRIELGFYEVRNNLPSIIFASSPGNVNAPVGAAAFLPYQNRLLSIIHNWRITTSRDLKNGYVVPKRVQAVTSPPASNSNGAYQPRGTQPQPAPLAQRN